MSQSLKLLCYFPLQREMGSLQTCLMKHYETERFSWLIWWAQCDHKGPYRKEANRSTSEAGVRGDRLEGTTLLISKLKKASSKRLQEAGKDKRIFDIKNTKTMKLFMAIRFAIAIGKTSNGFCQLHMGSPKSFSSRSKQKHWHPDTPCLTPRRHLWVYSSYWKAYHFSSRGDTFKVKKKKKRLKS